MAAALSIFMWPAARWTLPHGDEHTLFPIIATWAASRAPGMCQRLPAPTERLSGNGPGSDGESAHFRPNPSLRPC
jgi:hypothetical protein